MIFTSSLRNCIRSKFQDPTLFHYFLNFRRFLMSLPDLRRIHMEIEKITSSSNVKIRRLILGGNKTYSSNNPATNWMEKKTKHSTSWAVSLRPVRRTTDSQTCICPLEKKKYHPSVRKPRNSAVGRTRFSHEKLRARTTSRLNNPSDAVVRATCCAAVDLIGAAAAARQKTHSYKKLNLIDQTTS